ncbi:MAG: coenzyme F420-0:L-glutamate ligase [Anaerolineaceae bacterium]|nr:MAG: coenzyme F420-0:L-glutamate ligase [Anaerolineaceae bacterium]
MTELSIKALSGVPIIKAGDNLNQIIDDALQQNAVALQTGDVLVISSKIVSKAEGRFVDLNTVQPDERAREVAESTGKDPRIVALVLAESTGISRQARGVLVTQHRLGFISANAGIDQSNVKDAPDWVLLLPEDPDASASAIRDHIRRALGVQVGVVISDSHGRPFRMGNIGVAIGTAGLPSLVDLRGQKDLFGRELAISLQGYGDLIASAAHLVCGEGDEGLPLVLVRGLSYPPTEHSTARDLNRPPEKDLYR